MNQYYVMNTYGSFQNIRSRKIIFVVSLIISFLLSGFTSANAEEKTYPILDLRIGQWFSKADASWLVSSSFAGMDGRAELDYEDIDSNILLLEARLRPADSLSLGLNMGFGEISDGLSIGRASIYDPSLAAEAKTDIDGKVRLWGANLYLHLLPIKDNLKLYKVEETRGVWLV